MYLKRNVKLDIEMRNMNKIFFSVICNRVHNRHGQIVLLDCKANVKEENQKNVVIHFGNDDLTNLTKAFRQFC